VSHPPAILDMQVLPMEGTASSNTPSVRYKLSPGESKNRLLEEKAHPALFPLWSYESGRARDLSRERQLKGKLSECDHEAVPVIIPTDLIKSQFRARRPQAAHS
jgi:hypothetical protein